MTMQTYSLRNDHFLKGTLVRYYDLANNECTGRVKDASLYMLWIEDLEDSDRTIFIRYKDLTAVLEQE